MNIGVNCLVSRIPSIKTSITKSLFTNFLCWTKGKRRGSTRFGETQTTVKSRDCGKDGLAFDFVARRSGRCTTQARFQSPDPPEWSKYNLTSLSISWPAGVVNAQTNLVFNIVARRSGHCTTQPRFQSRGPPEWSMHNPTSLSISWPAVTYLIKNCPFGVFWTICSLALPRWSLISHIRPISPQTYHKRNTSTTKH